jgi:hypothetical protein
MTTLASVVARRRGHDMPEGSHSEPTWRKSTFSGEGGCVEVMRLPNGAVNVRDSKDLSGPHLTFSAQEWDAFTRGVRAGEFSS